MKVTGKPGTQPGEFSDPSIMKVINDKLYACDRGNYRVQILNTELEYVGSFGCYGHGDGQFNRPNDIAQSGAGNLYVSDSGNNNRVHVFDCKGQFLSTFSKKGAASKLLKPCSILVSSDRFVYVCDGNNKCVSVFKTSGEFVTSFGQFTTLIGIAVDDDGYVYVSDYVNAGKVFIF